MPLFTISQERTMAQTVKQIMDEVNRDKQERDMRKKTRLRKHVEDVCSVYKAHLQHRDFVPADSCVISTECIEALSSHGVNLITREYSGALIPGELWLVEPRSIPSAQMNKLILSLWNEDEEIPDSVAETLKEG